MMITVDSIISVIAALASVVTLCCVQLKMSKIKKIDLGPCHITQALSRNTTTTTHRHSDPGQRSSAPEPLDHDLRKN